VAAERFRNFPAIRQRRTDSFLLLQRRALQNFRDLRSTFHGRLTEADMVKSISAKYGPATIVAPEVDSATNERYDSKQKPVASWEDTQYSFSLVRSSYNDVLGLVGFSKRANSQAELAIAEAVKLDEQEGPKKKRSARKSKRMTWKWRGRRTRKVSVRSVGQGWENLVV